MSRLNGESVAGVAFLFFSALLMAAGQVDGAFGLLYPAYYILAATGVALVLLGYRTGRNEAARESEARPAGELKGPLLDKT
ncbi:MAG TPA: hypothetical protein VF172_02325 [Nitrososphaera sp.]|jgi:hypothetical protein